MRLIGYVADEGQARVFGDYLLVRGIENQTEFEQGSGWAVWVVEEDKLAKAATMLTDFCRNPAGTEWQREARSAADVRAAQAEEQAAYRKRVKNRLQLFRPLTGYGFGPLTYALIVLSAIVAFKSRVGYDLEPIRGLFFGDPDSARLGSSFMLEIRQGEIWRLITPIFIHFGPMHIIFNLMWLRDLGSMIEGRQSSWQLLLLVVVIAGFSNFAQYWSGGPSFGGMSGVVYGLLGYIWMRGKFDPASGLYLHPSTVLMMIIWFFLCFTPYFGHVANAAHAAGLGLGMAWGYLSSLRHR